MPTGRPLTGAHVYLPDVADGSVAAEDGSFEVSGLSRSHYRVRTSFVGYATVDTLVAVPREPLLIALRPTGIGTETLVVIGEINGSQATSVLPGVVELDASDLEQIPTAIDDQDLFQALEWLPGIERAGETIGGLSVRGSSPDQNLYLLEGAPVYHPSHAFSLISTFQTETLTDVRFYRGSFPAEHGGMLSAVLDARLKDGRGDRPRANVAINALNARFLVEAPITQNASFMIAARRSYLDKIIGSEHPVEEDGKRDTLRTGYYFYDWSAKLTFRPGDRSRISASYYRGRDDLDLRLPFDLSLNFSDWLRPADLFFEVGHRWGNEIYSVTYDLVLNPTTVLSATAYESRYKADERTFVQPTSSSVVASDYAVSLQDLGVRSEVEFTPAVDYSAKVGLSVSQIRFRSALSAELERSASLIRDVDEFSSLTSFEVATFVQGSWRPSERWRIEPGLRLTTFTGAKGLRVDPRLNASYRISPNLLAKAAVGTQVQYLHRLRDRYSFLYDLVSTRWVPVDGRIRPSTSTQVAAGVELEPSGAVAVKAETYYRRSEGVLVPRDHFQTKDGIDGPGIDVAALLGEHTSASMRSYGVELAGRVAIRKWGVSVTYTGSKSESRAQELGEVVFRPSRYDVPRSLRSSVSWAGNRWSFSAAAIARSGYPETVPTAQYAVGGPLDDTEFFLHRPTINNGRLPAYARLDLYAGYRFRAGGARLNFRVHVYNVTNRRNVLGRQYSPAVEGINLIERSGLPLLPLLEIEMEL
ncbi:MAG: TonB-dependent receptor [Rhodothermia bacterium]|nr:TonB-dependent receptor [Rhodothermia bacterium]